MTIKIVVGDLFDAPEEIYMHCANCFLAMHSGVAAVVRNEYPGAIQADLDTVKGDRNKLGTYSYWTGNHFRNPSRVVTIVNLYGQYKYGGGKRNADYDAIRSGLIKIGQDFPTQSLALPKIGSGLAGGDWNTILTIIEDVFKDREVTIYVHPKDVK